MTGADLRFYFYLFLRRVPLMAIIGTVISAAGLVWVISLPPVYRSTGTILVESAQISPKLAPVSETVGPAARLQVIMQEILTYDALLLLAKRQNIYPAGDQLSPANVVADLRGRIQLEPVFFGGNEDALGFSVSFDAEAPETAARIANELISIILERDASAQSSRASATLSFFQEEVDRLGINVAAVEQRLKDYKTQHLQALPDTLEFRRMLQINLRDRLLVLEREQSSLRSRRAGYVEYYRQTGRTDTTGAQSPEQARLAQLDAALANQRMIFTEDSAAISALKQQIASLEARVAIEDANQPNNAEASPLDLQLAEMDDRLNAIAMERESIERNDAELTASIAATPANEAGLSALQREYADTQNLYNAAAARLAEAATSEQIELRLQGERLTLMEPARPAERPMGPQRTRLAIMVGAAALVVALAVALGLELLNRTVRRGIDIERALGIEVLAAIPLLPFRAPVRFRLPRWLTGNGLWMRPLRS